MLVSVAAVALTASGCSNCMHKGMTITAHATHTEGAAGEAHTTITVDGVGFTPETMVTITFKGIPATDRGVHSFSDTSAITNTVGTFTWSKDVSAFPALNLSADPNADVTVVAKEVYVSCTGTTTIKAGALLGTIK